LQGLAETLRSELILYNIGIHIFFPGTIYSPGYVEENKTKPKITLKIEETDEGMQPDKVAEALLRGEYSVYSFQNRAAPDLRVGVQKGDFHISAGM
jgi:short-subunit dehydrogenase